MARKRMIDPSIWSNPGYAQLTDRQQLLYIGLFNMADDDGRIEANPFHIKMLLPAIGAAATGWSHDEIKSDLDAILQAMGQTQRYEVNAKQYLVFRNYKTWQKISHPQPSILPNPDDSKNVHVTIQECSRNGSGTFTERSVNEAIQFTDSGQVSTDLEPKETFGEDSGNTPGTIPEQSMNAPASLVKLRADQVSSDQEREGAAPAEPADAGAPSPNGEMKSESISESTERTRIPEGWRPTEERRAWAMSHGHWLNSEIDGIVTKFRNHHRESKTIASDWNAKFENWVIDEERHDRLMNRNEATVPIRDNVISSDDFETF